MLNYDQRIRLLEIAAETAEHLGQAVIDQAKAMETYVLGLEPQQQALRPHSENEVN